MITLPKALNELKTKTDWVVICGGPSVTMSDVRLVKKWVDVDPDTRGVIAVTKSYEIAPWADIIHARDARFWNNLYDDVCEKTDAIKTTYQTNPTNPEDVHFVEIQKKYEGNNSGFQGLFIAMALGAKNIYLLGLDMQHTRGKTHWHGGYTGKVGNSKGTKETMGGIFRRWRRNFEKIDYKKHNIINCSMPSKLNIFPKKPASEIFS